MIQYGSNTHLLDFMGLIKQIWEATNGKMYQMKPYFGVGGILIYVYSMEYRCKKLCWK